MILSASDKTVCLSLIITTEWHENSNDAVDKRAAETVANFMLNGIHLVIKKDLFR